jgi:hypothetical protein
MNGCADSTLLRKYKVHDLFQQPKHRTVGETLLRRQDHCATHPPAFDRRVHESAEQRCRGNAVRMPSSDFKIICWLRALISTFTMIREHKYQNGAGWYAQKREAACEYEKARIAAGFLSRQR